MTLYYGTGTLKMALPVENFTCILSEIQSVHNFKEIQT